MALACSTFFFLATGCKTAKIDTSSWIANLDDGIKAAQNENKRIILFFSADEDGTSRALKDTLLETADFLAAETERYVLVNLDFSASRYEAAMALYTTETELTKAEEQQARDAQESLTRDMKTAMYLAANESPSFYVLTKDGYPACQLQLPEDIAAAADFDAIIAEQEEAIADYEALIAAVNSSNGVEKARAIDNVFESTTAEWRYMVLPLSAQLEKLDPKNETGAVGKHLLALANGNASDAFLQQDIQGAASAFATVAENSVLTADEKQEAYYTAAYLLAQGGSTDYAAIRTFAQKSYDAAPTSEHADMIQAFIGQVEAQIDAVEQMQKDVDITADEGYTTIHPEAAPDGTTALTDSALSGDHAADTAVPADAASSDDRTASGSDSAE